MIVSGGEYNMLCLCGCGGEIISIIKIGLNKEEFENWKEEWNLRIPKCKDFICCHELDSCAIDRLCSQGSIYETYKQQSIPTECTNVDCMDCIKHYDCYKVGRCLWIK